MKKSLSVLTMLVFVSAAIFASSNWGGVTVGPQFSWFTSKQTISGTTMESKGTGTDLFILAEGVNYFGQGKSFGINYGLGIGIPLAAEIDGEKSDLSNAPNALLLKAGGAYKVSQDDSLDVSIGAGLFYSNEKQTDSGLTISATLLSLYGDATLTYAFSPEFGLLAGVTVSTPIYAAATISSSGVSLKVDINMSGVCVLPRIGAVYQY